MLKEWRLITLVTWSGKWGLTRVEWQKICGGNLAPGNIQPKSTSLLFADNAFKLLRTIHGRLDGFCRYDTARSIRNTSGQGTIATIVYAIYSSLRTSIKSNSGAALVAGLDSGHKDGSQ